MSDYHQVFEPKIDFLERIVMCPEDLLDEYIEGAINHGYNEDEIILMVREREAWAARMKREK